MRLFQAPLDTCLDRPPLGQPLSSQFARLRNTWGLGYFRLFDLVGASKFTVDKSLPTWLRSRVLLWREIGSLCHLEIHQNAIRSRIATFVACPELPERDTWGRQAQIETSLGKALRITRKIVLSSTACRTRPEDISYARLMLLHAFKGRCQCCHSPVILIRVGYPILSPHFALRID